MNKLIESQPNLREASGKIPITVVIPVKNEEKNLANCLAKLAVFQEVVVVDSSSIDKTQEIAKVWGAKVLNFEWSGGFPKKRNWVLMNYSFSTEWVLFLDADEVVNDLFIEELRDKVAEGRELAYWINYKNHFKGRTLKHGLPQRKLAVLKIGSGFYERIEDVGWSELDMEVHEHPIINGPVGEIRSSIDHLDYRGFARFIGRHNDYSTWEAYRYLLLKDDVGARKHLTQRQRLKYRFIARWWYPLAYFILTYIVRGGFLDGRAGFVYAMFKANYFMEIGQKIEELVVSQRSDSKTRQIRF